MSGYPQFSFEFQSQLLRSAFPSEPETLQNCSVLEGTLLRSYKKNTVRLRQCFDKNLLAILLPGIFLACKNKADVITLQNNAGKGVGV